MTVATKDWWNTCQLRTYDDFLKYYMTARTKDKGKPLRSWARIFLVGDTLEFRFGSFKFGELTPDNIFTFVATPHAVRNNAAVTFASSLYKAIPIMWQRVGTARYRICHTSKVATSSSYNEYYNTQQTSMEWAYMRTSAPEYFAGIQFNMLTGECVNRQADLTSNINKDTAIPYGRVFVDLHAHTYHLELRATDIGFRGHLREREVLRVESLKVYCYYVHAHSLSFMNSIRLCFFSCSTSATPRSISCTVTISSWAS